MWQLNFNLIAGEEEDTIQHFPCDCPASLRNFAMKNWWRYVVGTTPAEFGKAHLLQGK